MKTIYSKNIMGCYADGSFGHDHVRFVLADLVKECDPDVAKALQGEMSDDAWEEDAALDLLNEHTEEGLVWEFRDGDLVLAEISED